MSFRADDEFFIYLPIDDVKAEFGTTKKTFIFKANFDEFEVKLGKRLDRTKVMVRKVDRSADIIDAVADIRSMFSPYLVDNAMIARVQAILAINPEDQLMQDFLHDLRLGDPLSGGAEGLLAEIEERIENPDPEVEAKLTEALALRPNNRLLQSFDRQFRAGRELSERQLEIVDNIITPQVNEADLKRVEDALKLKPRSTFLDKLKEQVEGGSPLSPKQRAVVESIITPQVNEADLKRVKDALKLKPRSTFLDKLKEQVEGGSRLSPKQRAVVEDILSKGGAPQAPRKALTPEKALLQDLLSNGKGVNPQDRATILRGLDDIDSLSEDERKRLRHLIYRNGRNLQGDYPRDFVQRTLKKASRRLASLYMSRNSF